MASPPLPRPGMLSRRTFLGAGAAALALAACGNGSGDPTPGTGVGFGSGASEVITLRPGFADGLRVPPALVAGIPQRAPLALIHADGVPVRDSAPAQLPVTLTGDGGFEQRLVLERHDDGIPVPYFPMEFTAESPGTFRVQAELDGSDTDPLLLGFDFRVVDRSEVALIQVGDPMRPLETPTFDDTLGVEPLCTMAEPCPFHDVSLDDALTEGRPVAFMISTPGFCQTGICGPVLELMIEEHPSVPDLRCVHAEVYTDPSRLGELSPPELVTDAVTTYGLEFEPSLVLADPSGMVVARLDFTWDRAELREALALVR